MQPVNDDMDNLFRQAANHYPLNTQGADFDKLQQQMQASATDEVPPKKERKRRFGWLLLLLIPLLFILQHNYKPTTTGNQQLATATGSNKSNLLPQNVPDKNGGTFSIDKDSAIGNRTIINRKWDTSFIIKKRTLSPTKTLQKETVAERQIITTQGTNKTLPYSSSNAKKVLVNSKEKTVEKGLDTKQLVEGKNKWKNSISNKLVKPSTNSQTENGVAVLSSSGKIIFDNKNSVASASSLSGGEMDSLAKGGAVDSISTTTQRNDTAATDIAKMKVEKDSNRQEVTAQKKQLEKADNSKSYLYAGVVAGPDYSFVKSARTTGTGYNVGVIVGYQLGKHWSVETGLLWNHKTYYSNGEYVSVEKLQFPMHTQVLHINGYCGMFEIPLKAQYHLSNKSNGHWYIEAGLSSYLMKVEEYYYLYKRYNMDYYGKTEYKNSINNWFSVLQLGGGYQLKLGKKSSLRAEPYIKLPVSKIGIAQLPLSSTGLTIGYSRSF